MFSGGQAIWHAASHNRYPLLMSDQFGSETDALAAIGMRLAAHVKDVPGAGRIGWISVLPAGVLTERIEVADPATSAPAMVRRFRYVIRTDDLKLVESLMDALAALIPSGFSPFCEGTVPCTSHRVSCDRATHLPRTGSGRRQVCVVHLAFIKQVLADM